MTRDACACMGIVFGALLSLVICTFIYTGSIDERNQSLIDNGYAHYDSKTGDFVFHEKGE